MATRDEEFMSEALKLARLAESEGEVPVGAVVVFQDRIIGRGRNSREQGADISGHAEINAIKDAERHLGKWTLEGCAIYVTLEPCLMCAGAIKQSRLKTIVFGAKDEAEGAVVSRYHVFDEDNANQTICIGVCGEEASTLLKDFFAKRRS